MKGQVQEFLTPWIVLLVIGVIAISLLYVLSIAKPVISSVSPEAGQMLGYGEDLLKNLDYVAAFIVLGLYAASIISAIFVDTHPVFFVIFFFLLIISLVAIALIANGWEAIIGVSEFQSIAASYFTITSLVFQNAVIIALGGIALWGMGFYAKDRLY